MMVKMNILWLIVLFLSYSSCFAADSDKINAERQALNQSTVEKMEDYRSTYKLPSLSMSIAIQGEVVFEHAVGYADIETGLKATPRTQYSVGSIAKPMTSIALGCLMDAKKIDLEADIHHYLPDYPKSEHKITIKQLASHTAGIGRPWKARNQREYVDVRDHTSPLEALDLFQGDELIFVPGEDFAYTSSGYILLSAAIESAAEQYFIDYMQQSVWDPLEMNQTEHDTSTAGQKEGSGENGHLEATYYASVDDNGAFTPSTTKRDRSYLFGGGGFISTPTDMVKMAQAFYSENFLSAEAKKAILTPVKLTNGENNEQSYGLGWRMINIPTLRINGNEPQLVHHGGVTDKAATAFLLLMPEYKAAVAYAVNMNARDAHAMRPSVAEILADYVSQSIASGNNGAN
ncbi:class A beta-lactamase-related serine hydrolase [Alteromonadaceae bacterium M269]|nr:class A beta-lactamase-related serine hydrolase [Alteromonadaceae bacterium M269]